MSSKLIVIAAVGEWGNQQYIGEDNRMPWKLPRDMRFFRTVTRNAVIIMGRKTFESLGSKVLAGRRNIVVTHQRNYAVHGGETASSLDEAITKSREAPFVFVIGGGQLYAQALDIADHLLITEIHHVSDTMPLFDVFRGDTVFPPIPKSEWILVGTSRWFRATSARSSAEDNRTRVPSLRFRFLQFDRRRGNNDVSHRRSKLFFGRGRVIADKRPEVHESNSTDSNTWTTQSLPFE